MIVLLDFQLMVMVFLFGKLQKLLQKKLEKKQYIKKERQLFSFNFQHLYIVFKCRNYFQNFNMCNSIPCFQMSNFIFCNISYISFFKIFFFSSTFLNKTKFKSTTCGAGKISSAGQGSCVSCDAGKAPNIDKNACENCAAGTYELNNICTPCAVGYMQDVAAQTSCKICPGKA